MKSKRTRNFATVVYPESANESWISTLEKQHIPALVSPVHDKDINTEGGMKKPHYHVLLLFDGVKTIEQAREAFEKICGVGAEPIQSLRAYARYLCHLDNPEKHQYDINDVKSLSGADYMSIISLATDKYSAIGEMMEYCLRNDIESYAVLLMYAKNNRADWFRILCDNGTGTIVQFLKSRYWETHRYEKYIKRGEEAYEK